MPSEPLPERISKLEVDTPQGYSCILANEKGSYLFSYDRSATPACEVSLLMPLRATQYSSGALQPVFQLQPVAGLHQLLLVVPGLDAGIGLRVNLADRDMDVQMLGIGMHR